MDKQEILKALEANPIIMSISNDEELEAAVVSPNPVAFIIYGSITNIGSIIKKLQDAGKHVFVHLDLIDGLQSREVAVDFILGLGSEPVGIISTRGNLVRYAKQKGLVTVQRFFVLDSKSLKNLVRSAFEKDADFVEILPGLMPKILRQFSDSYDTPLITGGLITAKDDVYSALEAGCVAVSTTNRQSWQL